MHEQIAHREERAGELGKAMVASSEQTLETWYANADKYFVMYTWSF